MNELDRLLSEFQAQLEQIDLFVEVRENMKDMSIFVRPSFPELRPAVIARALRCKPAGVLLIVPKEIDFCVTYDCTNETAWLEYPVNRPKPLTFWQKLKGLFANENY